MSFLGTVISVCGCYFATVLGETGSFCFFFLLLMSPDSSLSNASGAESLAIQPQKLLILDARSYAAAVANRAKGGGCECPGEGRGASVLVSAARAHLGLGAQFEMNGKPCSQPVLRELHLLDSQHCMLFSRGKWRRERREARCSLPVPASW